ncbi:diguanylate cyclase domain-containing protein [Pseudomonadota bacterium]
MMVTSFPGGENQPDKKVTVNIGTATCPDDGTDVDTIIKHADEALYHAKHTGRNRVCSFHRLRSNDSH